jgi:hypothetical protein
MDLGRGEQHGLDARNSNGRMIENESSSGYIDEKTGFRCQVKGVGIRA